MTKALDASTAFNDRRQGTLSRGIRAESRGRLGTVRAGARDDFDRLLPRGVAGHRLRHHPSDRAPFGITEMQMCLAAQGYDNQGHWADTGRAPSAAA